MNPPGATTVPGHSSRSRTRFFATVLLSLVLAAGLAAAFGFISPDSWYFLSIAQSLRAGHGCSLGNSYFAEYACGYPLAIALTAPAVGIGGLLVASKFTNLVLLASAFLFVADVFENPLVPTVIFLNPITLGLYRYTWTENAFLFAFCGSLCAISRIQRRDASWRRWAWLLALFLIFGCASRYFFGPFAAIMFVGIWLIYGARTALRAFPAFAAAGVCFLAYLTCNRLLAGYSTGLLRLPAPESPGYLLLRFLESVARDALFLVLALLILRIFVLKQWVFSSPSSRPAIERQPYVFLAWSGAGFLLVTLAMRIVSRFEMFNYRVLGPGEIMLAGACVGLFTRLKVSRYPVLAVAGCALFSIFAGPSNRLPAELKQAATIGYQSPLRALREYHSLPTDAKTIVSLQAPDVSKEISGNPRLYYGWEHKLMGVSRGPDLRRETADQFTERLQSQATSASCVIDFTPFPTLQAFENYADLAFTVELKSGSIFGSSAGVQVPRMDPSMKAYLESVFRPGQYVPCPGDGQGTYSK